MKIAEKGLKLWKKEIMNFVFGFSEVLKINTNKNAIFYHIEKNYGGLIV